MKKQEPSFAKSSSQLVVVETLDTGGSSDSALLLQSDWPFLVAGTAVGLALVGVSFS